MKTLEEILKQNLPSKDLEFVEQLLYGPRKPITLDIPATLNNNFEIRGFSFCETGTDKSKVTRVCLFQNGIVEKTTCSISKQKDSLLKLGALAISAVAALGVNVFCFQEIWNMPVAFCTQKKLPWVEFAEDAFTGPSTTMLKDLAQKFNMVIISPILERDDQDVLWNTAVVINNDGNVLGISRKNHIPVSGRYSEAYYYTHSKIGHPVFQTKYGRIAVSICYERHHPQSWFAYGLNGAQIVFNPSATVQTFSEHIWPIEARDAAIQNGFYTCAINRVGSEFFETDNGNAPICSGPFFGSSYISSPDGSRTPGLSLEKNELLIADLNLQICSNMSPKERIGGYKLLHSLLNT